MSAWWTSRKAVSPTPRASFSIPGLAPGTYDLKIQFLGYSPATVTGIVVEVGKAASITVKMDEVVVKEVKTVEVSAERRLVEVKQGATVR